MGTASSNRVARRRELGRLLASFSANAESVEPGWRRFFEDLAPSARVFLEDDSADWSPPPAGAAPPSVAASAPSATTASATGARVPDLAGTRDSIRALMLIRAYRVRGHLEARLDPLGLAPIEPHPELNPKTYGFTENDLDRPIFIDEVLGLEWATLREILKVLKETYASAIGVQFMHIQDPEQKSWIQRRIENKDSGPDFTELGKRTILERLTDAETFERFLDKKFTGTKRFGLEGGEATVPAIEQVIKRGGQMGLQEIVIGMPHRGRLNILGNVMKKPASAIFAEFQGSSPYPDEIDSSGDVKYHLGASADRTMGDVKMHLSLTANPSHLEAVNPVVAGKVRAKQNEFPGEERKSRVLPLLMHGDAAFAGQGLVPETLGMSQLKGYRVGGTIHFIVNNQIGFTTSPVNSRSGPYCSDVALMIQAPIFHVNGDDPEAVVYAARVAIEFRQEFESDVVIDMFCYRRYGHNEGDEPAFTQPLMYKHIGKHPTVREIYAAQLAKEGVVAAEESQAIAQKCEFELEQAFEASSTYRPNKADWLTGVWEGFTASLDSGARRGLTGVDRKTLSKISERACAPPEGFSVHSRVLRQLKRRAKMVQEGKGIDWSTGEMLAFGSLLVEGSPVRLTGQDSGRGTFSQRHAVLVDQETEEPYVSLNAIEEDQAGFEIVDSPLSEASVLGFEYGYSLSSPQTLVLWEAQFGDFVNGAQVIIDQFVASGESKWLRMSGLTLLLPHGFEGQGPEHSSARLERFLQLCAEDNMQVVNCTTPANYFHALRRQIHRKFRKPLVVFTPKSLLRHKAAVSNIEDFDAGSSFHRVLPFMDGSDPKEARRIVFCTGKVYYDLVAALAKRSTPHGIRILRVEQLYPFPEEAIEQELSLAPQMEVVWCQEEPMNMGAWSFIRPCIKEAMDRAGLAGDCLYAGRPPAASPATGLYERHLAEQTALVAKALTLSDTAAARAA